jgi:hypothetical protein
MAVSNVGVCAERNPRKAKNSMDGRQDVGCNQFPGIFAVQKSQAQKWQDAPAWMPTVTISLQHSPV